MSLTFKQLKAFVVVAREQNFARAAERLHITPPTLTASIKTLEEAIDLRLFDRSTRSVVLTTHARSFLPVAERLLDDLEHALADLHNDAALHTGSVVVTGATSFIAYVLSPAVAQLAVSHPAIRVRLTEGATESVRRSVRDGECDFGVTTLREPDRTLHSIRLSTDRFGLMCHRDHPLAASQSPLSMSDLAPHAFVGLTRMNGVHGILEADQRLPDSVRHPAYEVSDIPLLAPLIERGVGAALIPAMGARVLARPSLTFKPLAARLERSFYFIMNRGRSLTPAVRLFVQMMIAEMRRLPRDSSVAVDRRAVELSQLAREL